MSRAWIRDPVGASSPSTLHFELAYFVWHALKSWCIAKASSYSIGEAFGDLKSIFPGGKRDEKAIGDPRDSDLDDALEEMKAGAERVILWAILMLPINLAVWYGEFAADPQPNPSSTRWIVILPAEATLFAACLAFLLSRAQTRKEAEFYRWQLRVYMLDCILFPLYIISSGPLSPETAGCFGSGSHWARLGAAVYMSQAAGWAYLL